MNENFKFKANRLKKQADKNIPGSKTCDILPVQGCRDAGIPSKTRHAQDLIADSFTYGHF